MSQLKTGAVLSYLSIFLTNIVGVVLTPFIIKSLGDAEYGLYSLIGAFVGYISVLDLGLNGTIVRFVAKYRAENSQKAEENFLAITMLIYGVISLLIALVGIGLYFNLHHIFSNSLSPAEMAKAKVMFAVLIFNLVITLPGGAFSAICAGYEQFVYPRVVSMLRYLVRTVLVVVLLLNGGEAIGLIAIDTVLNILFITLNGWYVLKKLNVKFKLRQLDIFLVKEIFAYSIWVFVFALVLELQWRGGQVILGIKTDTTTVAIYSVGVMLGTYYAGFAGAINGVFLPKAMQMVVNGFNGIQLTDMMIKIGRIALMVLLLILGGFILFGQEFIYLWIGDTYKDAWLMALLIMLTSTNILVQSFADSLLRAKSLFRFKGLVYIFLFVVGTVIGYFFINRWKGLGMLMGICTCWFIAQMILNVYFVKKLNLQIVRFYKELLSKSVFVFTVTLIVGYAINFIFPGFQWVTLSIKIMTYTIIYFLAMYHLVANNYEKDLVRNAFRIYA
ncbi:oligosaccharide flippase family protein [Desertivirga xinjiangensis]|uniref:oligosaccharide flippase family protein n=1 Tax=Desertivirga xinjiangensis TaxID=539206 RepID=UPI00210CE29D